MRLTEEQLHQVSDYLHFACAAMGLSDWEIRLPTDPPGRDAWASMTCTYGQRVGLLRLCDGFFDLPPIEIRMCIVHELVHCHLDVIDTAKRLAEDHLAPAVWQMFERNHTDALEWATDGITRSWCQMLPLPKFGKDPDAPDSQASDQ